MHRDISGFCELNSVALMEVGYTLFPISITIFGNRKLFHDFETVSSKEKTNKLIQCKIKRFAMGANLAQVLVIALRNLTRY